MSINVAEMHVMFRCNYCTFCIGRWWLWYNCELFWRWSTPSGEWPWSRATERPANQGEHCIVISRQALQCYVWKLSL